MKSSLFLAGAVVWLGGDLRAQADTLEKIQKEVNQLFQKAGSPAALDKGALGELVDRTIDLAIDQKGEAGEFDALTMALQLGGYLEEEKQEEVFTEAMDRLVEGYLADDRMAQVVLMALARPPKAVAEKAKEYLDWIARDSESDSVQCAVGYAALSAESSSTVAVGASKALIGKFEALSEKYGAIESPYGQPWSAMIDQEIEGLKLVGTPAKEIEGKDLDGAPFKLSDYRGKAVLLDFWGYW